MAPPALEIRRDGLTPFDLNGTIDVELALGLSRTNRGGRHGKSREHTQDKFADRYMQPPPFKQAAKFKISKSCQKSACKPHEKMKSIGKPS